MNITILECKVYLSRFLNSAAGDLNITILECKAATTAAATAASVDLNITILECKEFIIEDNGIGIRFEYNHIGM